MKRTITVILTVLLLAAIPAKAMTASTCKCRCYTISSGKTTVYRNSSLTGKTGTVSGSKELTVLSVSRKSCKIQYSGSEGKKKTGYIATKAVFRSTSGKTSKIGKTLTLYRRPGAGSCGSVPKGRKVTVLGTSGKYTQIRFTCSGVTRLSFVKTDRLRKAIS